MKYLFLATLALLVTGCMRDIAMMKPNHLGITPSCEWEVQEGSNTKVKPKIQTAFDWNF